MMDGNLVGTSGQSTQQNAIFCLLQADTEAKERIDQAQETSRSIATDTDAQVTRLLEDAHTEAVRATQSLVEQARTQAQLDAQHIAEERAHQHVNEAVALVAAWVSGEEL